MIQSMSYPRVSTLSSIFTVVAVGSLFAGGCGSPGDRTVLGDADSGTAGTSNADSGAGDSGSGSGGSATDSGGTVTDSGSADTSIPSCTSDEECDDSNECNGVESCVDSTCSSGSDRDDGEVCVPVIPEGDSGATDAGSFDGSFLDGGNAEAGDAGAGCFVCFSGDCVSSCTNDAECDDFNVCTGTEICLPSINVCFSGTPMSCDDSDDCTGNECDPIRGCNYPLIDEDKDGHASTDLGTCGDDCNDADKTIFEGAEELCDGKDNNCDDLVDETAPTWYEDCDQDGFAPAGAVEVTQCDAPTNTPVACPGMWTSTRPGPGTTDCWDEDADARPRTVSENSSAWASTAIAGATSGVDFDWNCDAVEEPRFTTGYISAGASCGSNCPVGQFCLPCSGSAGYTGAPPACGSSGTYTNCTGGLLFDSPCERVSASRAQECR